MKSLLLRATILCIVQIPLAAQNPPNIIRATRDGDLKAVAAWLDKGVYVDTRDELNLSLLMIASKNRHWQLGEYLISRGANVDLATDKGDTALSMAVQGNDLDIARFLIKNRANAGLPDIDGVTPLMLAAKDGHIEMAELLIEAGANVNAARIEDRSTALDFARQNHHQNVVSLLQKAGAIEQRGFKLSNSFSNRLLAIGVFSLLLGWVLVTWHATRISKGAWVWGLILAHFVVVPFFIFFYWRELRWRVLPYVVSAVCFICLGLFSP